MEISRDSAMDGFSHKAPLLRSMATATCRISTGTIPSGTSTSIGWTTIGMRTAASSLFATFTVSPPQQPEEFCLLVAASSLQAFCQSLRNLRTVECISYYQGL